MMGSRWSRCGPGWMGVLALGVMALPGWGCGDMGPAGSGNSSPTGTYLSPNSRDGQGGWGYQVLDEACENVLDEDYLRRFETPMFRGVAHHRGVAHLVDGSLLWSVDVRVPTQPWRLSMRPLEGHPLKIAVNPQGHLFVAAGEAGLHVLRARDATAMEATLESGDATATAPRLVSTLPLPGDALDVETLDASRFVVVAAGVEGLLVVDAQNLAAPALVAKLTVPGFANAVTVDGTTAWVAACRTLVGVDVSDPYNPRLLDAYGVPHGHARGIASAGGQVYVAGGEALFVYDATDTENVVWTGYYAEPDIEGFYVNDVVVRRGIAYIAAGDESVRAVNVKDLSSSLGFPAEKYSSQAPPGLEEPVDMPPATSQPRITEPPNVWTGDPIAVGLIGDLLMVLGNFRWMGERTLQLLRVDDEGEMTEVERYIQPNHALGVDALDGRQVVHRGDGFTVIGTPEDDEVQILDFHAPVRKSVVVDGGLVVLNEDGRLYLWHPVRARTPTQLGAGSLFHDLAASADGQTLLASNVSENEVWWFKLNFLGGPLETRGWVPLGSAAFPGYTYLVTDGVTVWAYEWVTGVLHVAGLQAFPAGAQATPVRLGLCEAYDIADFFSGRMESRTRLRLWGDRLHVLCPEDEGGDSVIFELDLSQPWAPSLIRLSLLPPGRYVDFGAANDAHYVLAFDNNRYESRLLRVAGGTVTSEWVFLGHANSLLGYHDSWFVIDGDGGARGFWADGDGALHPTGLLELVGLPGEVSP